MYVRFAREGSVMPVWAGGYQYDRNGGQPNLQWLSSLSPDNCLETSFAMSRAAFYHARDAMRAGSNQRAFLWAE